MMLLLDTSLRSRFSRSGRFERWLRVGYRRRLGDTRRGRAPRSGESWRMAHRPFPGPVV